MDRLIRDSDDRNIINSVTTISPWLETGFSRGPHSYDPTIDLDDEDTCDDPELALAMSRVLDGLDDEEPGLRERVLYVLSEELTRSFTATPKTRDGIWYIHLEHADLDASAPERGRQIESARSVLEMAGFRVWPVDLGLEVSDEGNPHFERSDECACGAPEHRGCICPRGGVR